MRIITLLLLLELSFCSPSFCKEGGATSDIQQLAIVSNCAPTEARLPNSLSNHSKLQFFDAVTLAKEGKIDQALSTIKETVAENEDVIEIQALFAALLLEKGGLDEAIESYKKILRSSSASNPKLITSVKSLLRLLEKEGITRNRRKEELNHYLGINKSKPTSYEMEVAENKQIWPKSKLPVKVFIQSDPIVANNRILESTIMECFNDWSEASGGLLQFVFLKDCPEKADIAWAWKSDLPAGVIVVKPTVFCRKEICLSKVDISMSTNWNSELFPLTTARMKRICLTATGRAVGLFGVTFKQEGVMYAHSLLPDSAPQLSISDKHLVQSLYSAGYQSRKPGCLKVNVED